MRVYISVYVCVCVCKEARTCVNQISPALKCYGKWQIKQKKCSYVLHRDAFSINDQGVDDYRLMIFLLSALRVFNHIDSTVKKLVLSIYFLFFKWYR